MGIGDALALTLIKTTKSNQQLATSGENQNVIVTPQQMMRPLIQPAGWVRRQCSSFRSGPSRSDGNLNELRSKLEISQFAMVLAEFQLEIAEFKSQKAYLITGIHRG